MNTQKNSDQSWDIQHSTQGISLFVGGLLIFMGLWGVFFTGFAGLHLRLYYSGILTAAGAILFYFGYKNKSMASFLTCALFAMVFALFSFMGFKKIQVGHQEADFFIVPNYQEQGSIDYIFNAVLALILLGGAIDWLRRYFAERSTHPSEERQTRDQLLHH